MDPAPSATSTYICCSTSANSSLVNLGPRESEGIEPGVNRERSRRAEAASIIIAELYLVGIPSNGGAAGRDELDMVDDGRNHGAEQARM